MNEAHFHLIVNHLPIVGVLIGILVLLAGFMIKNHQVKNTALGIFIFSALTSFAAFYSGEGAQELVGNIPGISETLMHDHEEYAEMFFTSILILGFISLVTLFLEIIKSKIFKSLFIIVLLASLVTGYISTFVATSGGEIRHSEIRKNSGFIQVDSNDDHNDNNNDHDDDHDD